MGTTLSGRRREWSGKPVGGGGRVDGDGGRVGLGVGSEVKPTKTNANPTGLEEIAG